MKLLIIYSTTDGHTRKIAEYMASHASNTQRFSVIDVIDIKSVNSIELKNYSHIIVGASIRYGKFAKPVFDFIEQQSDSLNKVVSGFYSVNLTARKADKNTPETNVYTRKFLENINWKPSLVAVFAGALLYPRYGFFDKFMIKLIMKITKGETDTSKEIEYTDWESVGVFIDEISKQS